MQQPCVDHPVHSVWGLWSSAGGGRCIHRLLADHGGGHHPAAEPEYGGEDGTALRAVESLLHGWYVRIFQGSGFSLEVRVRTQRT